MKVVPAEARCQCYIERVIIIAPCAQACYQHFTGNQFHDEAIELVHSIDSQVVLTKDEIMNVLNGLDTDDLRR